MDESVQPACCAYVYPLPSASQLFQPSKLKMLMRIFLVISLLISVHCGAQQTEYWLGFSENSTPSSEDKIKVIISSASAISGDVSIPAAGWSSEFVVPAGASSQLEIPVNLAEITTDNIPHHGNTCAFIGPCIRAGYY